MDPPAPQQAIASPRRRDLAAQSSPSRSRMGSKPKRPPPVTPKRFTKFFTPRLSFSSRHVTSSRSARQLRDITKAAVNRGQARRARKPLAASDGIENSSPTQATQKISTSALKRKHVSINYSSPLTNVSPCKRTRIQTPMSDIPSSPPSMPVVYEDEEATTEDEMATPLPEEATFCQPLRRLKRSNVAIRTLERSFGALSTSEPRHSAGWIDPRHKSSNFYSHKKDRYQFSRSNLPFSTAACHTNDLVATGTEDGAIYLLDATKDADLQKPVLIIGPHLNAVMDMQFSEDDMTLASCGGDQTARLTDMRTQQVKAVFQLHSASLKQVRFQPGDNNLLASCSRDGMVTLWDVRCSGTDRPAETFVINPGDGVEDVKSHPARHYTDALHIIHKAHPNTPAPLLASTSKSRDTDRREPVGASVTSLSFLSASRSHLLVTASESTTSLKIWDLRSRYARHSNAPSIPIASTAVPQSHLRTRHFGVTSLSVDSNASTIYALSRDSTLYAYSTNHLVLGQAPEMLPTRAQKTRSRNDERRGLGPLYGFRHPRLRVTSFFVKSALRTIKNDNSELIATGSCDAVSVLFSTDRRDLPAPLAATSDRMGSDADSNNNNNDDEQCPIYEFGTALTNGHASEVSALAWTSSGSLLSGSDDYTVRCWREDRDEAVRLREYSREAGVRLETEDCGWADVSREFDDCNE